jgi:hypothetical protein
MDSRTRYEDFGEAIETTVERKLAELHTSEPCTIVSWDPQTQTAVLQPTNKTLIRKPDGTSEWVQKPQIPDVPLQFPHGGGSSTTYPMKPGDEVLATISSRSQDVWQQNGGDQQIIDARIHDLSNAFAVIGFRSNPKALPAVSTISTQTRNDAATHVVDHNPLTGTTVTAEGTKVKVTATSVLLVSGDPYVA